MSLKVSNTTIQNRSKRERLTREHIIPAHHLDTHDAVGYLVELEALNIPKEELLFSVGVSLLGRNNNPSVQEFLGNYDLPLHRVPTAPPAFDILGSIYQYSNSKHENLVKGSFYTGKVIANDFVNDLDFANGQVIFDPACGSGVFLFRSNAPAEQIYGVDFDPIAVMIAKFNYFLKFPDAGKPNLYHCDFFEWFPENRGLRFSYVIGNPPYGANLDKSKIPTKHVMSGESFSYFIELGCQLLERNGKLRFLVPESLLNVKRHADIRNFLLNQVNLTRIKKYSSKFSGVMSDVYLIEVDDKQTDDVNFTYEETSSIKKTIFKELQNQIFVYLTKADAAIIDKVASASHLNLSDSIFGLGVVTGDNKSKLLGSPAPGAEPIYSGKEVMKYSLLPPKNYLVFDRANLQQVAPDDIYRAPQKLLYKVITKHLQFAVDKTGSLSTNSANIVIPQMVDYDIYAVLALLNSDLYSFLHLKLFGGVNKIAKEHLIALPFPRISEEHNRILTSLAKKAVESGHDLQLNNYVNFQLFALTQDEAEYITAVLR